MQIRQAGIQGKRSLCAPRLPAPDFQPLLSLLTRDGSDVKENKIIVISLCLIKPECFDLFLRAQAVLFVNSKHIFGLSESFQCSGQGTEGFS